MVCMKRAALFAAVVLTLPTSAAAQVVISEVMYDLETGSDSGREWVEVFNSGSSAITLTEWKLFENGSNHTVTAHTGGEVMASGGYAVIADNPTKFLEDNASYSGVLFDSAFSLSNSGETLILRCCGSELSDKDSISYSSETGAAGDGKTLQRASASVSTFSASVPTPGSGILSVTALPAEEEEENTNQTETATTTPQTTATTTSGTTYQASYVPPPLPVLFADGGDDRTVIVGADTEFRGRAYNREQDFVEKVRFSWNFGDGTIAEGQSVLHHFEYPGKYMAVLSIALDRAAYSDRMVISAEPAKLSFTVLPDSSVAIENRSGKNLDLSRWHIKSFGRDFSLPEDTIILAGATLRIPQKTLGFSVGPQTELQYPNGFVALKAGESTASSSPETPIAVTVRPAIAKKPIVSKSKGIEKQEIQIKEEADTPVLSISTAEAQTAGAGNLNFGASSWWLTVVGFAGLAGVGAAVAKYLSRKEWTIIEESD